MEALNVYQHSGKTGPLGYPLGLAMGIGAALVGGFVYAFAIHLCPFIYINFFLTFGLGWFVGWAVGRGAKLGKLRCNKGIFLLGLFAGLVAVYFQWVGWIYFASGRELLLLNPISLFLTISMMAKEGVWEIFGSTPRGIFLWLIWIIEAGIIGLVAMGTATGGIENPFCEKCDGWIDDQVDSTIRLAPLEEGDEGVVDRLSQGDLSAIHGRPRAATEDAVSLNVECHQCPSCNEMNLVTLKMVAKVMGEDGKVETQEEPLIQHLVTTLEDFESLREGIRLPSSEEPNPTA